MGVAYKVTNWTGGSWNPAKIHASAFLSDAKSVKIKVIGGAYVALNNGNGQAGTAYGDIDVFEYDATNNPSGVIFNISDNEHLATAKAGNMYLRIGDGTNNYEIYVTNYATADGAANDTGYTSGGSGTTDPDDSGSTGGSVDPSSMAYKIANKQQLTNVPTIYLTVPDAQGKELKTVLFKDRTTNTAEYHTATIQVVDNSEVGSPQHLESFTDYVQIKVRGNSTADPDKKPYRLKFAKEIKDADGNVIANCLKHDLLGQGYTKRNWALMANYFDRSMIRNALTYHLGKYLGLDFCPGYKFVDVVINGDYRGTYQITDHVEAGTDRVNIDEDNDWMIETVSWDNMLDTDYGIKASTASSTNSNVTIPYNTNVKNPEPADDAAWAKLKDDVITWEREWNTSFQNSSKTTGWQAYNDVESFIKYYLAMNITDDYDGFFVMKGFRKPDGPFFWGPIWDKDLAYGNCSYTPTKAHLTEEIENGQFRWNFLSYLHNDYTFVSKVKQAFDKLIADGVCEKLCQDVDNITALIDETKTLNYEKWSLTTDCGSGVYTYSDYSQHATQLKTFLTNRFEYLKETFDAMYATLSTPVEETYNPTNAWWSTGISKANKFANVKVTNRSLAANQWNSFCLPFDATEAQVKEAIGCDYELKIHSGMAADGITMLFTSPSTKDITAGEPYLIKPASNVTGDKTFNGVIISELPNQPANYNGHSVTFDDKHFFCGTLFLGYNLSTNTDYKFASDVYTDAASLVKTTSDNEYGARAFIRVPANETPSISFEEAQPAPTRQQLTNLPTIYLDAATVDDAWKGVALEVFDKYNVLGQGVAWTKTTADVSAQYQGSGAKNKDSYRLKFESKIKLMGANKYKQWVLLANDDDPSMINNALAKELGDAVGMPWTPGYQFVDLYVNDTYMGTYQVTDRVKAEEGRSLVSSGNNKTDWQVRFNDDAELAEDGTQDYIKATNGVNVIYKNPDPKDLTDDQVTALRTDMQTYFNNVFTKNTEGEKPTYPNFAANVDKDQLINWYICQEILGVYKGFSSIEAYRSVTETAADNLLHFGPLWDSEKAFGNHGEADAIDMSDLNADTYLGLMTNYAAYDEMKSLFNYLWTQPWFGSGVRDKWNALKTVGLLATLKAKAGAISGTLSQSQPKNAEKWTESLGGAENYSATITNIKNYLTTRFAYLDTKFNARAAGLCDHTFTYVDNGNGTHKHYCTKCDYTDVESDAHTLTMVSGKAHCSVCGLDVTAEVTGNEGEKVYILDAGTSKVQYITKNSGFTPAPNNVYKINEQPEEETVFENVYWLGADGKTNYADKIVVDDSAPWNVNIQIMAKEATHTRSTAAASIWGTVCLPFKTKTNEDVTLFKLSSVSVDKDGKGTMVFEEASSTGGLTPLVFKKKDSSATSVKFTSEAQTDNADPAKNGYATVKATAKMSKNKSATKDPLPLGWQYYGNVQEKQTVPANTDGNPALYFISSNKFYRATSTLKVSPFRAYFEYTAPASEAKIATFSIADEEATKIVSTLNEKNSLAIFTTIGGVNIVAPKDMTVNIYTTAGTLAKRIAATANESQFVALPCGMYVINGAKFVIK